MPREESRRAGDWFAKARRDLKRVEAMLGIEDLEGAGLHLQQAAEKYLKGYLLAHGWRLRRTHDLEVLLNEAVRLNPQLEEFRGACQVATEFYVEDRYPFISSPSIAESEFSRVRTNILRLIETIEEITPPTSR